MGEPEYSQCETQQLSLLDQRIWLDKLAILVPEYGNFYFFNLKLAILDHWLSLAQKIGGRLANRQHRMSAPPSKPHPPETNPPGNQGFSRLKNREVQVPFRRFHPPYVPNQRNYASREDYTGYQCFTRKPHSRYDK